MTTKLEKRGAWHQLGALVATLMVAATLSACGDSGARGGVAATDQTLTEGEVIDTSGTAPAASVSLLTSDPMLGSDGKKTATLTAIVKSTSNVALSEKPVSFSTTDNGVVLKVNDTVTDEAGQATATLSIADRSLRDVTVVAKSGKYQGEVEIRVAGTVLQISGSNTIVFNSPTEFSLSLRDSSGGPLANAPFTVTSTAGNTVTIPTGSDGQPIRTDAQGQAKFTVTGSKSGVDTLVASAQGAQSSFAVSVSSKQLTFESPLPLTGTPELIVSTPYEVAVKLVQDGVIQAGQTIQFSSTRGQFTTPGSATPDAATTDAQGVARVTIQSTSSGLTTITATANIDANSATVVNRQVEFVSRTPASIQLQASPPVIGANVDPDGTKSSQLIAKVRDANDNPVKGVRVNFSAITDPSGGRIEPSFALTDSFGVATASFIAGSNATGLEATEIQAMVAGTTVPASTTKLTVSEIELSVRVGTGNKLEEPTSTRYMMPWTAVVADSSQNPVANAKVVVALETLRFRKGVWVVIDNKWSRDYSTVEPHCPSEDANRNRLLDQGEDTDGDGQLDPGAVAVAVVRSPNSRTDENGLAEVEIIYTKDLGGWVEARLIVTITTVDGTESSAEHSFWLPSLAKDLSDPAIAPPGINLPNGPFGRDASCASPD